MAGYFRGDNLTVRHCLFSDTSTEGLYVIGSCDVRIEGNIFRRNNVEQLTGYYPSAVKIFNQSHRVTCRDNLVMDNPNSNGIWYDVGNQDGVFVNNWVQDSLNGFFFEISKGALCAGNVFVNCDNGIRILNSSNVHVWHNTLINSPVLIDRNQRSATDDHFGWHPATGPDVDHREGHIFADNLLAADAGFDKPLLRFEQPEALCGRLTQPQVTQFDGNVYVRGGNAGKRALLVWSPVPGEHCTAEINDLKRLGPRFEVHSRVLNLELGSVFKSPALGRYELTRDLGSTSAVPLPTETRVLLGWSGHKNLLPGAYPFVP